MAQKNNALKKIRELVTSQTSRRTWTPERAAGLKAEKQKRDLGGAGGAEDRAGGHAGQHGHPAGAQVAEAPTRPATLMGQDGWWKGQTTQILSHGAPQALCLLC